MSETADYGKLREILSIRSAGAGFARAAQGASVRITIRIDYVHRCSAKTTGVTKNGLP